jgi:hypothetical protein
MAEKHKLESARIEKIGVRIQKVYIALVILVCLGTILKYFQDSTIQSYFGHVLLAFCFLLAYFGLKQKTGWVIPFILVSSALGCLSEIANFLIPALNMEMLFDKILDGFLLFFFAYQIMFFSKQEVRLFFGFRGHFFY